MLKIILDNMEIHSYEIHYIYINNLFSVDVKIH